MTFEQAHKAIKSGDVFRLRTELENGLDPDLSNQYSWTILMVAAMGGNTQIGRLLIDKGADLDKRNNSRDTALSLAVLTGHPSFVRLLLTSGASLDCHPHGNSLSVFLDWVEKYSGGHKKRIENIRRLFEAEQASRGQSRIE